MTDHDKLRDAIALVRDLFLARGWGVGTIGLVQAGKMVADAAESTLPKTKTVWYMTATARRHAPYAEYAEYAKANSLAEVGESLRKFHEAGFSSVTITSQEVPA